MNFINASKTSQDSFYTLQPFYFNGKPLDNAPVWGMTLLKAGSMRFRWNEDNQNRTEVFRKILSEQKKKPCSGKCASSSQLCDCKRRVVPIELIHSKKVVRAENEGDTFSIQADGIITSNPLLVPSVTVADCVPLFLYDTKTKATGIFHSGWKGTGIIGEGIKALCETYGSEPKNICVAIGPHIGECCYYVDEERAKYFITNFGENCITKREKNQTLTKENPSLTYSLSLTQANIFVLKKSGIEEQNIVTAEDCTCCSVFPDSKKPVFGSYRRQAAFLQEQLSNEERSKKMTVQAAFVIS